jgi:hypothetical protein
MKLFTLIFYTLAFTQLSYTIFVDFCLISLFCTSAYSYDLLLPENNKFDDINSDPFVAVFYIIKYLLHFINHYFCKLKHELMELKYDHNNIYSIGDGDCDILTYLQYKCIEFIEWYEFADNYYTEVIINQTIIFIQTFFLRLFRYIVSQIITSIFSKSEPTFNVWQTNNNLKKNIEILDLDFDLDAELELELETDSDEKSKKTE